MSSSSTPAAPSIDYSLLQDILSSEQFDQTYFDEPYHISPDYPLDPFLDIDSFSPTVPSIEMPNANPTSLEPSGLSHTSPASSTSSHQPPTTHSPSLSPRTLKRESPSSPPSTASEPPCKRSHQEEKQSANAPRAPRQPHNQVERKYREGLNAALERLRRAVPLSAGSYGEGAGMGQAKISKATVLVRAIEHIKTVEAERDALREENERLRARKGTVWTGGEDLSEGFMMDY